MKRREFITLLGGAVALTWPRAVNAEKAGSSFRISFLALVPEEDKTLMSALLERLHELGYREDTNMVFQYRSAEGRPERLAPLALELYEISRMCWSPDSGHSRLRQRRRRRLPSR